MPTSLRDPDWWFTSLLGLIVISLIWSYVCNAVVNLLARLLAPARRWRDERVRRERRQVELLAAHPELLIMELVRSLFMAVLFLALVGFYLFFSILGTSLWRVPNIQAPDLYNLRLVAEICLVLGAALGLCSLYFGTPLAPRLHLVMRARADYENRCKRQRDQTPNSGSPAAPPSRPRNQPPSPP